MKLYLIVNPEENSINFNKEFISKVIVYPILTPPKDFLSSFSETERKRIYTHLTIWEKNETAIIIEDTTYTNLDMDELFTYLYLNDVSNSNLNDVSNINSSSEILFYGKYNSMCRTYSSKMTINNKSIYTTRACAGAYAYRVNAAACKALCEYISSSACKNFFINKRNDPKLNKRDLDTIFFNFTYDRHTTAYVYHPSIIKLMNRCEYECMNPNEEENVVKKEWTVKTYMNWFVFLCLLLLAFIVGLLLYYIYRMCFTSKYNKVISTGYYEEESCRT